MEVLDFSNNERLVKMTFASFYPHYVTKVERKGRKKEEYFILDETILGKVGFSFICDPTGVSLDK